MAKKAEVNTQQRQETLTIIQELIDDGSDPDSIYLIEHHLSCENLDFMESATVELFQIGFDISEIELVNLEDDLAIYCCDLVIECPLDPDLINDQIAQILPILNQHQINYDGWGTYFEEEYDENGSHDDNECDSDESTRLTLSMKESDNDKLRYH